MKKRKERRKREKTEKDEKRNQDEKVKQQRIKINQNETLWIARRNGNLFPRTL
jgi:hypothetical protein